MPPESASVRRWFRWVKWSALAAAVAVCGWVGWCAHDHRAAIREAEEAGWLWDSRDPVSDILADWRAVGRKATWTEHYRFVELPDRTDLAGAAPLLARLQPTTLSAWGCPNPQLDALRGITALRVLSFTACMGLQNVDGLSGLPALQQLDLGGCTGLRNVDGLRGLPALQFLDLTGCTSLSSSALRELRAALPKADITFPDGTHNPPPK